MKLSQNQIDRYNNQGLIPGPDESEEQFIDRSNFCLNLRNEWQQIEQKELPFEIDDEASKNVLSETSSHTKRLYGIAPSWVPLFFSNYKLPFWIGGCAWIFQLSENSPISAFLQLRSNFRKSEHHLKIYSRSELIAHEIAHVGRMAYEEPKFEEFFAYQSSPSSFRRWMGPIFQSSKESFLFVILLALTLMINLALNSFGWINIALGSLILIGFARLIVRHRKLQTTEKKLNELLNDKLKASHLCYRLTDKEIISFSKMSSDEIKAYIINESSFRWNFLKRAYFS